eukprot:m.928360 g.928360  ORF g.928360 m.928360 type:complete len:52 (+) comp23775_c0_seq41:368-523(+)
MSLLKLSFAFDMIPQKNVGKLTILQSLVVHFTWSGSIHQCWHNQIAVNDYM